MTKLISIIIPTYNSGKTIKRAINSIFKQKFTGWEIVIIDSFSKDKTLKILNSFKSKKIKIFQISKIKGLARARYLGIKKSRGKYIAFLDSDDEWNRNKLFEQLKFIKLKSAKFSCTNFTIINKVQQKQKIKNDVEKFNFNYLLSNRPIALSTVIIEKKLALNNFNQYLKNQYAEDYLWWLIALKNIKYCYVLKKNLSNIYIEGDNRSVNFVKNYLSLYKIYRSNLKLNTINIASIFVQLIYKTFKKNLFKFKSFFFKN